MKLFSLPSFGGFNTVCKYLQLIMVNFGITLFVRMCLWENSSPLNSTPDKAGRSVTVTLAANLLW